MPWARSSARLILRPHPSRLQTLPSIYALAFQCPALTVLSLNVGFACAYARLSAWPGKQSSFNTLKNKGIDGLVGCCRGFRCGVDCFLCVASWAGGRRFQGGGDLTRGRGRGAFIIVAVQKCLEILGIEIRGQQLFEGHRPSCLFGLGHDMNFLIEQGFQA